MNIPPRTCSCRFRMEVVAICTEQHPDGELTYVCAHCDRDTCTVKGCVQCKALTQADAHNTKT